MGLFDSFDGLGFNDSGNLDSSGSGIDYSGSTNPIDLTSGGSSGDGISSPSSDGSWLGDLGNMAGNLFNGLSSVAGVVLPTLQQIDPGYNSPTNYQPVQTAPYPTAPASSIPSNYLYLGGAGLLLLLLLE